MESIDVIKDHRGTHICVCVCTYKRPLLLKHLLLAVCHQATEGLFTYSIAVVDNDASRSAEAVVAEMRLTSSIATKYEVEPRRSIALARNKVIGIAEGDFLAFIDDDEFPATDWLLTLFKTCIEYDVDGVLGPVVRHFDETPPAWLQRSRFFVRPVYPTGAQVDWLTSRTSNVLLKQEIVRGDAAPFRPEFRASEDNDFFRRKIEEGYVFIWCADAVVFETIPPNRWTRIYQVRRALLQGACECLQPNCGAKSISKSVVAIPLYAVALPFSLAFGQHIFMSLVEKMSYHAGKLLKLVGIDPIQEEYVT
jgi:succinoglycan biosynthesis protein ExoM